MSVHQTLETYTKRFSENVDEGWSTLRAMHELGYELFAHPETELMFQRHSTGIVPVAMSGRLVWVHSMSLPIERRTVHKRLLGGCMHFVTPLAAANWWEIEIANNPQPAWPPMPDGPAAAVSTAQGQGYVNPFATGIIPTAVPSTPVSQLAALEEAFRVINK